MKTTTLGRSGWRVSRIAFGTWQLGGEWGPFDDDTGADLDEIDKIMASARPVAGLSPETM
ncbi:hypothetical protein [Nocardia sp. NPDC049526]|uniref:hypothetical protein n=1 Tax=Nocardia sp. NPDC049526 TaxID=3364316 RepID=UPI0037A826E8